jgi:hypothetical protein
MISVSETLSEEMAAVTDKPIIIPFVYITFEVEKNEII